MQSIRTGIEKYDVHKLVPGSEKIILGGNPGYPASFLSRHIQWSVLCHSIMVQCWEQRYRRHFPDTDEKFKDADSIELLKEVRKFLIKPVWTL